MSTPDNSEQGQVEDLADALEQIKLPVEIPEVLTLSNGIKVRCKPFPRMLLRNAISQYQDPEVPVIKFEDGSEEENPNDPDYLAAFEKVHEERLEAAARVTLGYGIAIDEDDLPDGMVGPMDDSWMTDMKKLGVDPGDCSTDFLRRYQWLNLYAIPNEEERTLVFLVAQQATGLVEAEVIRAMRYFQDLGARRARDYRAASSAASRIEDEGSGDRVREGDPVARVRVRGERRGEGVGDSLD
jgi:hypothetical protein